MLDVTLFCCLQSELLHFVHIYNGRGLEKLEKSAATGLSYRKLNKRKDCEEVEPC